MKKNSLFLFLTLAICFYVKAKVIRIPGDFATIQLGIDNSSDGDTILVAPGTYFENINFKKKNIIVASNFIKSGLADDIKNTIIDGSKAANPDSASCVYFCAGEDSTAVIQGFTLTKGKGTKFLYPNGWFREGGGVFVNSSSPTIKNNLITGNEVLNKSEVNSAGGGGIRSNLGNPHIYNNVITLNKALFGAAILLDLSDGTVKNNIIYRNYGATDYSGGGAFWIYGNTKVVIENNTITANSLGGIYVQVTPVSIRNNIIWGNDGYQIVAGNAFGKTELIVNNNDIEGGYKDNIDIYPEFTDKSFILGSSSPAIDAGLDKSMYNDNEDPVNQGIAIWPSLGKIRNDLGAYGGPHAAIFPSFESLNITTKSVNFGKKDTIGIAVSRKLSVLNQSTTYIQIDSIKKSSKSQVIVKSFSATNLMPMQTANINLEWTPKDDQLYEDSIYIFHSLKNVKNPLTAYISGKALMLASIKEMASVSFINIYPNPFKESATIQYKGVIPNSQLDIFDLSGKEIRSVKIVNTEGNITLDRNKMSSGIYIYKLKSEKNVLKGKFVISE